MRKKFKIFKPCGTQYKTTGKDMLVMNNQGVFFIFNGEQYYPSIRKLSDEIGNYDVNGE